MLFFGFLGHDKVSFVLCTVNSESIARFLLLYIYIYIYIYLIYSIKIIANVTVASMDGFRRHRVLQ